MFRIQLAAKLLRRKCSEFNRRLNKYVVFFRNLSLQLSKSDRFVPLSEHFLDSINLIAFSFKTAIGQISRNPRNMHPDFPSP
jgi:hypothetical protein